MASLTTESATPGLDMVLQQAAQRFKDDRPRATRPLTDQELRLEQLHRIAPEAYELVIQLPEEYQKTLALYFPIHGEEPFVGVEINGKGIIPADAPAYAICKRLTEMVWEENPQYLQWGMERARRMRSQYPANMTDDNPEELIDA